MALCTTEVEYISLCTTTKEVVWLWGLLGFLEAVQHTLTVIYQDNQLMIALVGSGQTSCRTKNIEVHFYYTKDKIVDGTLWLQHCPIDKMIPNGLIKVLTPKLFAQLWDKFMVSKSIVSASGRSIYILMCWRPTGCKSVGTNWAVNRSDVDGARKLLVLALH